MSEVCAHFTLFSQPTELYEGFLLILEPFETDNATVPNPIFHFTYGRPFPPCCMNVADPSGRCLDPAIAIKPVFERFSTVVITSGTISPLDMYPKMLQFTPVVQETYSMTLTRNSFLPLVSHTPEAKTGSLNHLSGYINGVVCVDVAGYHTGQRPGGYQLSVRSSK